MAQEKVEFDVGGTSDAIVVAHTRRDGTDHDYLVTLAGHTLPGHWSGDARYLTHVDVPADHPLHQALRLIAAKQQAQRDLRDANEWHASATSRREREERGAEAYEAKMRHQAAKDRMKADALACEILGLDAVVAE